jgi:hypothetical protein
LGITAHLDCNYVFQNSPCALPPKLACLVVLLWDRLFRTTHCLCAYRHRCFASNRLVGQNDNQNKVMTKKPPVEGNQNFKKTTGGIFFSGQ